jgi:glycogen(starch) synthase
VRETQTSDSPLADRRLAVLTPWYPSPQRPFAGSFVRTATAAVAERFRRVDILHTEDWPGPADPVQAELVRSAYAKLAATPAVRAQVAPRRSSAGYYVSRIPTPVTPKRDYADWARSHERALRLARGDNRLDADVVHGHVGTYGGYLACRFAPDSARVVLTEHASFLGRMLNQPASRAMYRQVVERCDAVVAVSGLLRRQLAEAFPEHVAKLVVVPNVVDIDAIPARPTRVTEPLRWIYIGNMAATKGVPELVEAFALAAAEEPRLRLTLLGSGVLVEPMRKRVAELGLIDRVRFQDAVPPERVPEFLHANDLLVHPSKFETFGMTTVEAIAAGTPVLVTRCGGPEETLAGLDGTAGGLIDVSDDPEVILAGWREIAGRMAELDLPHARAALAARYGASAVAERLARVYQGLDPDTGGTPAATATHDNPRRTETA